MIATDRIDPVPAPLGRAHDAAQDAVCPPALEDWLFGSSPDGAPAESLFALIDASRAQGLADMITTSGLEHRCLYTGALAATLADDAPWLVQMRSDSGLLRKLMSAPPAGQTAPPWLMWPASPATYIRSALPFDDLWRHLRHFTMAATDAGDRKFLRFWDPLCFEDMLAAFASAGLDGLFADLHSVIIYHSRSAARLRPTHPVARRPVKLTPEHSAQYVALRQARLTDAIVAHFRTLPEFAQDEPGALLQEVSRYMARGRELGLTDAKDLHQMSLGLALARGDQSFRTEMGQIFKDPAKPSHTKRRQIMAALSARIDAAKAAHAASAQAAKGGTAP